MYTFLQKCANLSRFSMTTVTTHICFHIVVVKINGTPDRNKNVDGFCLLKHDLTT